MGGRPGDRFESGFEFLAILANRSLPILDTCSFHLLPRALTHLTILLFSFLELKQLSSSQLTELYGEMESLVAALSETLIAELALRDELEYEKELKNQFISLLLAVQNRRRQHHVTKKRTQMQSATSPLPQHRSLQEPKVTDILALSNYTCLCSNCPGRREFHERTSNLDNLEN